ncbi:hypothetical protein ACF0H5_004525 [Mactra antiquata]
MIGKYTCVKSNGSSVVDYVLCKPTLFDFINNFVVDDPNIYSVHCCVNFSISCNDINNQNLYVGVNEENIKNNYNHVPLKYKWNNNKKYDYINACNEPSVINYLDNLTHLLTNSHDVDDVKSNLNDFYTIVNNIC